MRKTKLRYTEIKTLCQVATNLAAILDYKEKEVEFMKFSESDRRIILHIIIVRKRIKSISLNDKIRTLNNKNKMAKKRN